MEDIMDKILLKEYKNKLALLTEKENTSNLSKRLISR